MNFKTSLTEKKNLVAKKCQIFAVCHISPVSMSTGLYLSQSCASAMSGPHMSAAHCKLPIRFAWRASHAMNHAWTAHTYFIEFQWARGAWGEDRATHLKGIESPSRLPCFPITRVAAALGPLADTAAVLLSAWPCVYPCRLCCAAISKSRETMVFLKKGSTCAVASEIASEIVALLPLRCDGPDRGQSMCALSSQLCIPWRQKAILTARDMPACNFSWENLTFGLLRV